MKNRAKWFVWIAFLTIALFIAFFVGNQSKLAVPSSDSTQPSDAAGEETDVPTATVESQAEKEPVEAKSDEAQDGELADEDGKKQEEPVTSDEAVRSEDAASSSAPADEEAPESGTDVIELGEEIGDDGGVIVTVPGDVVIGGED